jgi:Na+(H+)/acetate symporter ActP
MNQRDHDLIEWLVDNQRGIRVMRVLSYMVGIFAICVGILRIYPLFESIVGVAYGIIILFGIPILNDTKDNNPYSGRSRLLVKRVR